MKTVGKHQKLHFLSNVDNFFLKEVVFKKLRELTKVLKNVLNFPFLWMKFLVKFKTYGKK